MKVEKFIKLVVDYESIDIDQNWVAFSICRTLENVVKYEGIVDKKIWSIFLEDPFSFIEKNKIIKNNIFLVQADKFKEQLPFHVPGYINNTSILNDDSSIEFDEYKQFNYSEYKSDPTLSICSIDEISVKKYGYKNNDRNFPYLMNLNKEVVYYNIYIDLPLISENKQTEGIFTSLLNAFESYPTAFNIISHKNSTHVTREDYIAGFINVINSINDPYLNYFNDISIQIPEFSKPMGTLIIEPENFKDFNAFFVLTKKYVHLETFNITEEKFSLIIGLAILKTYFNDVILDDFYSLFPSESTIAQSIALDYKLKPKNHEITTKKIKI